MAGDGGGEDHTATTGKSPQLEEGRRRGEMGIWAALFFPGFSMPSKHTLTHHSGPKLVSAAIVGWAVPEVGGEKQGSGYLAFLSQTPVERGGC